MLRIVLDANIYISALIKNNGVAHRLFQNNRKNPQFIFIISDVIIDELKRVLGYPKVRKLIKLNDEEIEEYISCLKIEGEYVDPPIKLEVVKNDKSDNIYFEAAVTSKANYIVSGDNHLLVLKNYEGISILTLKDFYDMLPY